MADIPNIPITPNVNKLIGISKFKGAAIKLYAYRINPPKITRFNTEKSFLSIFVHLISLYEVQPIL
jgi:hypothetical protein